MQAPGDLRPSPARCAVAGAGPPDHSASELEDIVAGAIIRMLNAWEYLPAKIRLALVGDALRIARWYTDGGRELPPWLHQLLVELAIREQQRRYAAQRRVRKGN